MNLYYFTQPEFERGGRNWYSDMDPRLLILMDVFRHRWGRPVQISPHPKALGRVMDESKLSDHNFTRWGVVLAADVMPEGMDTRADAEHALELANEIGLTSIGLYPHWQPGPGLHLGTRRECRPGGPALWGAVRNEHGKQVYCTLDQAVAKMPV